MPIVRSESRTSFSIASQFDSSMITESYQMLRLTEGPFRDLAEMEAQWHGLERKVRRLVPAGYFNELYRL